MESLLKIIIRRIYMVFERKKRKKLYIKVIRKDVEGLIIEVVTLIEKLEYCGEYKKQTHNQVMDLYVQELYKCRTLFEFSKLKNELIIAKQAQMTKLYD